MDVEGIGLVKMKLKLSSHQMSQESDLLIYISTQKIKQTVLNQKHMTKYLRYTPLILSDYLGETKDKTIYLQLRFNSKISQKEY